MGPAWCATAGCGKGPAPGAWPSHGGAPGSVQAPTGQEAARGTLVIVGGGLAGDNEAVYRAILDARSGSGPLCVFPTASAEPEESLRSTLGRFDRYGGEGTAKGIPLTVAEPGRALLPEVAQEIRQCSGFFFVGGVQSRIVEVFRPGGRDTPALEALRERFREGAVVSGSSAGAAIMTDPMIGGGDSRGALLEGVRTEGEGEGGGGGVRLEPGLGLWSGAQVDQHHLARGRWARLVVVLLATPGHPVGFGIDENTALWVRGDTARVVGASGVLFFDVRGASREEGGHGGRNLRFHLLGAGDEVLLPSGNVRPGSGKITVPAGRHSVNLPPETDLFRQRAFQEVLVNFALSADSRLRMVQDGYEVELVKGEGFAVQVPPGKEGDLGGSGRGETGGLYAGPFVLHLVRGGGSLTPSF